MPAGRPAGRAQNKLPPSRRLPNGARRKREVVVTSRRRARGGLAGSGTGRRMVGLWQCSSSAPKSNHLHDQLIPSFASAVGQQQQQREQHRRHGEGRSGQGCGAPNMLACCGGGAGVWSGRRCWSSSERRGFLRENTAWGGGGEGAVTAGCFIVGTPWQATHGVLSPRGGGWLTQLTHELGERHPLGGLLRLLALALVPGCLQHGAAAACRRASHGAATSHNTTRCPGQHF